MSQSAAERGGRVDSEPARSSPACSSLVCSNRALVSEALGILAHDLRNPIAALLSNVSYLNMASGEFSADVRETLADIELSIEALGRMTGVLDLLSAELRESNPARTKTVFTGGAVLDAIWPAAARAAQSHGLRLVRGPVQPERAVGSESGVQAAVQALIHNAIMCAPARSEVRVSVERRNSEVVFAIEDDGPPLAQPYWDTAFTLKGPSETKSRLDGRYSRGLGLYVAGREASLCGVLLRVAQVPRGSRFEVALPSE
jgi:K+-sensing histidine kinase KdpD